MPKKILIVEDNPTNRLLLKDILIYHGYEVLEAEDGAEGVQLARQRRPDLIIMDMQMPVMNGFDAIKELKADPQTRDLKIIAITSLAMKGDKERVLATGCEAYLAKPIDTRQLPQVIRELLGEED